MPNDPVHTPIGDVLQGADEISDFIFGSRKHRRRIYHLSDTKQLPVFRMGNALCARKSRLVAWIENQEEKSIGGGA